jgi:hypothetical protein
MYNNCQRNILGHNKKKTKITPYFNIIVDQLIYYYTYIDNNLQIVLFLQKRT